MKRTTFRMSDNQWVRIRLISAMMGKSIQECFEDALGEWLHKHGEALGDVLSKAEVIANSQQQDKGDEGEQIPDRQALAAS